MELIRRADCSEIKKETLKTPIDVHLVNYKLRVPSKFSTLAVKLVRDAFFGDKVLEHMQCIHVACIFSYCR